jgi:hypothetical protein
MTHFQSGGNNRSLLRLLSAALLVCLTGAVGAEDREPKIISSRLVFGQRIANGQWCPLVSQIENPGDQARRVAVVISFDTAPLGREKVSFVKQVYLPPKSEREVCQLIRMDFPARVLLSAFDEEEKKAVFADGTEMKRIAPKPKKFFLQTNLTFVETGQTSKNANNFFGMPLHPGAFQVGVVDDLKLMEKTDTVYSRAGLPFVLGERSCDHDLINGKDPEGSFAFVNENLPCEAEENGLFEKTGILGRELPDNPFALKVFDALVIGSLRSALDRGGMSSQQQEALASYVRGGRTLVVLPSSDPESYADPFWQKLLPVRVYGQGEAEPAFKALGKMFGGDIPCDPARQPQMAYALPGQGEAVLAAGENVVLARRAVGSGTVWFLAVTGGALEKWSGAPKLWAKIFDQPSSALPGVENFIAPDAAAFLGNIVGIPAPNRTLIALTLGGYFFLAAAMLALFRWKRRTELAWPVMLVLAAAAVGIIFIIESAAGKQIGFVQGELGVASLNSGEGSGEGKNFVGLFSHESLEQDIKWTDREALATALPRWSGEGKSIGGILPVREDDLFSFDGMRLNRKELHLCRASHPVKFGDGVELVVGYNLAGVCGEVRNNTGVELRDCILRLNRRTVRLGDLTPGKKVKLENCELSWKLGNSDFARSDEDLLRRKILAEALRLPPRGAMMARRNFSWPVAFYGWAETPKAPVEVAGRETRKRALQLLAVSAGEISLQTGKMKIPAGVCGLRMLRGGNRMAYGDANSPQSFDNIDLPLGNAGKPVNKKPAVSKNESENGKASPERKKEERHSPTGWKPGISHMPVRVGFDLPPELRELKIETVTALLEVELIGLEASLRIRKPSGDPEDMTQFEILPGAKIEDGKCRLSLSGNNLKKYLGQNGELPEFELRFMLPPGSLQSGDVKYRINIFDVEVEGSGR